MTVMIGQMKMEHSVRMNTLLIICSSLCLTFTGKNIHMNAGVYCGCIFVGGLNYLLTFSVLHALILFPAGFEFGV